MTNSFSAFLAIVLLASITAFSLIVVLDRFLRPTFIKTLRRGDLYSKWQWVLGFFVMTDTFVIANHLLFRGLAVGIWDVDKAYRPYLTLVADHAAVGRFLHWDPWSEGGMPAGGDPQFGAFSPISVAAGLMGGGTGTSFTLYWMFIWWIGGVGMLLLGRHLKASAIGATVVSVGFLFSGTYIGHAEHTSVVVAYSFLPFITWRLDAALTSRRWLPAVEAGALWGLSALSGYPALVLITGMFVASWVLGRWLFWPRNERASRPSLPFTTGSVAAIPLIGILVLAPTYFAYFYEGAGTSGRVGALTRDIAVKSNPLAPGAISTLASPFLPIVKVMSGVSSQRNLWPETDVSGCALYTGAAVLILALLALWMAPRDGWRWFVLGVGLLYLGFALGPALPLRGWLYDLFPPTRYFRHPTIFSAYFTFSLCILAFFATHDLERVVSDVANSVWRRLTLISVVGGGIALSVFYYYAFSGAVPRLPREGDELGSWHAAIVWGGMIVIAVVSWLLPFRSRRLVFGLLLLSLAIADGIYTPAISMGIYADSSQFSLDRWERLDREHSRTLDLTAQGLAREDGSDYHNGKYLLGTTNDQMITKVPAFNTYTTAINRFQRLIAQDVALKRMAIGAERIWFSPQSIPRDLSEESFRAFVDFVRQKGAFPILVHQRAQMSGESQVESSESAKAIEDLPPAEPLPVRVINYSTHDLSFVVTCKTEGWLLVTDRWALNWLGTVNGKPVEIFGGNFIFRAIQVPAGENTVRFSYQTPGFPWLVILSWSTLVLVAIISVGQCLRKPRLRSSIDHFQSPITG